MSPVVWGMLLAGAAAWGVIELVRVAMLRRRPALLSRIAPYLRDLDPAADSAHTAGGYGGAGRAVFGPVLQRAVGVLERTVGGGDAVRRRLQRAGSKASVEEFRSDQVVWASVSFAVTASLVLAWGVMSTVDPVTGLIACGVAALGGIVARDAALTRAVRDREARLARELPTLADLMALAVAAGEGPVAALERVAGVSNGAMSDELRTVLADVRTGTPLSDALTALATRSGVVPVARFAETVAVAVDRGTPLVDVLHAQAADVRESHRRDVVEAGARREVLMLVPIVFLVLPTTVIFAFYPGLVSLSLTTP